MLYLKQSTASQSVIIGPFVDKDDGNTQETGLTIANTDIRLSKNGGNLGAKASGGGTHDEEGWYTITLDATDTNTVGRLQLFCHIEASALPVYHEYQVLEEAVYDAMFGSGATAYLTPTTAGRTLDVTAGGTAGIDWGNIENKTTANDLSGTDIQLVDTVTTATTATNLTNLPTIPADWLTAAGTAADFTTEIQAGLATATGVNDLSNSVAAVKVDTAAILVDTTEIGTAGAGLTDITLNAASIDLIWDEALSGHSTGGSAGKALRNASGVILHSGTADAGAATTIDLETGVASAVDDFYNHTVVIITAGTGAGQERIITDYTGSTQQATITPAWSTNPDATSEYELIPGTAHAETQGGGYAGGAVWIGPSGSTGTQLYVDGTVDNPIDDGQMANAKTVADALNLRIFRVEPTSSITLGETLNGYSIEGIEYTLNLGTQDVSNTYINGATLAASTATGTGTIYDNCIFDNAVTLSPCVIRNSYLGDTTITAGSAGNFFINYCVSRAAGAAVAPNFDFGAALNASNLNLRAYSGGIELENMGAGTGTYNCSIDGNGGVIINANCSATSNLAIRGAFTLTDNSGGAVTVTDDARFDVAQVKTQAVAALNTDTYAEPGQGAPAATTTLVDKIGFLYKAWRNKSTQTATTYSLYNDDAATVDHKATVSDDATTATKGEVATGP